MAKPCRHHGLQHFKVSPHEWKCSGCGNVDVWRSSWAYFGSLSCRKCHCEPAIEFVACSEACAKQYDPSVRVVEPETKRAKARDELSRIDAELLRLNARRERLKALTK